MLEGLRLLRWERKGPVSQPGDWTGGCGVLAVRSRTVPERSATVLRLRTWFRVPERRRSQPLQCVRRLHRHEQDAQVRHRRSGQAEGRRHCRRAVLEGLRLPRWEREGPVSQPGDRTGGCGVLTVRCRTVSDVGEREGHGELGEGAGHQPRCRRVRGV